ncbi:MAG: Xaa-Pro dipeptidase [Candidatus Syntrophoarchaeum caldarius]|uniref:Xaa-Pro dipeptidase n=1 Tax=Candidatus Syntropharchaeum caldarium TaxID=1838285 RepID=A0A1F2PBE3_9EURY|nr:MAG: Xaa-Pro dipeptidase [Candidatus Syntrophoarchaeum caldarius]
MSKERKWMLLFGDSIHNQNMYYLTHFLAADPFIYLGDGKDEEIIIVSTLEFGRAEKESRIKDVRSISDYADVKHHDIGSVIVKLLEEKGLSDVFVEKNFSIYLGDKLRDAGIKLIISDLMKEQRAVKREDEIESIKSVQQATTIAMKAAIELIGSSKMRDGLLTSEMVKKKILHILIDEGCESEEPIVACGRDAADPHSTGSGKLLLNEPIVIDIFPRDMRTRYHADMTRTVLVGEPAKEVLEMYETVLDAKKRAIGMVKAGVDASEIHSTVNDTFEARGYGTLRKKSRSGFIHLTGHGVGLSLHEDPVIGENEYTLQAGNVITIEPGLYIPSVGGVRIEDMILVRANGSENLTNFPSDQIRL